MANPADTDYVRVAVERIGVLLKRVAASYPVPVTRVYTGMETRTLAPCWWLYPGAPSEGSTSADYRLQTYTVNARLVLGDVTTGYDGALAAALWTIMPMTITYVLQWRHLVTAAGERTPRGLMWDRLAIEVVQPFGEFSGAGEVGMELAITLPFELTVDTVYP